MAARVSLGGEGQVGGRSVSSQSNASQYSHRSISTNDREPLVGRSSRDPPSNVIED
jgi:hypothetical protein